MLSINEKHKGDWAHKRPVLFIFAPERGLKGAGKMKICKAVIGLVFISPTVHLMLFDGSCFARMAFKYIRGINSINAKNWQYRQFNHANEGVESDFR